MSAYSPIRARGWPEAQERNSTTAHVFFINSLYHNARLSELGGNPSAPRKPAKVGQAFSLPGERSSPYPFFPSPPAHHKFSSHISQRTSLPKTPRFPSRLCVSASNPALTPPAAPAGSHPPDPKPHA